MTSPNRLDVPKWSRIEAGFYSRRIGLNKTLELVHKNHTPADRLHLKRWVVRVVEKGQRTVELDRFQTKAEAQAFADAYRKDPSHG